MTSVPATAIPRRHWLLLLLAVWFGLVTGFVEVTYREVDLLLGRVCFLFKTPDHIWVTPLAEAAFFLVPGLILLLLSRLTCGRDWIAVGIFTYSSLFFASMALMVGGLHWLAVLILVVGLAMQTTRLLRRRIHGLSGLFCRTTGYLLLANLILFGALMTRDAYTKEKALARLPPPPAGAPNVILITMDTVRR